MSNIGYSKMSYATPTVNCPLCKSAVIYGATRCPQCHGDIGKSSIQKKVLNSGAYISIISSVASAIALIVALWDPISAWYAEKSHTDGASMGVTFLDDFPINVGLDDVKAIDRVKKVTKHISVLRFVVSNNGLSLAGMANSLSCITAHDSKPWHFRVFDPNSEFSTYPTIQAKSTVVISAQFTDNSDSPSQFPLINSCKFIFSDKYINEKGLYEIDVPIADDEFVRNPPTSPGGEG
jgi:hypothetical protein